jgi:SAM-dependent methyltransferase
MLKWFRRSLSPQQTALAMIGARSADRIVVAGQPEPALAAELAGVTGLNGCTLVASASPEARDAIESAARRAGSLVEFDDTESTRLPGDPDSADVVVLALKLEGAHPADDALFRDAFRILRPGGRLIVIDGVRASGPLGRGHAATAAEGEVVARLVAAGGRAARRLARAEGVAYYEAQRPRGARPERREGAGAP